MDPCLRRDPKRASPALAEAGGDRGESGDVDAIARRRGDQHLRIGAVDLYANVEMTEGEIAELRAELPRLLGTP